MMRLQAWDISMRETLLRDGYCVIEDALPPDVIHALNADLEPSFAATPLCQGRFYGERTRRFGGLLKRSRDAQALVLNPVIMDLVEAVLKAACDRIQLNVMQAIEILPGQAQQLPHRDHGMWQGAKGAHEYLVNVIWPLDAFSRENVATLVYPGSHGEAGMARAGQEEPIVAQCPAGFLGSTAHGAGANISQSARRAIVVGYCLGWLKPYENHWLAYPPAVARHFSPELAALVGYAQDRPDLGNYEGQCPSILLGDNLPDHVGAIDALRPGQEALLAAYLESGGEGR